MAEPPERLVINTNVLVAFIKTKGLTRKIILDGVIELCTIRTVLSELRATQRDWNRGQLAQGEVGRLLDLIPYFVTVLRAREYKAHLPRARRIMKAIDEGDTPVLAAALGLRAAVWSNDRHFQLQKVVRAYTTHELAALLATGR